MTLHGLQDETISLTYKRDGKKQDITFRANSESKYMLGFHYASEGETGDSAGDVEQFHAESRCTGRRYYPGN